MNKKENKPSITFRSSYSNGTHYLQSGCPEADALFTLLRRGYISPNELPLVGKMGLSVVITGDNKELVRTLQRENEKFTTDDKGVMKYGE